MTFKPLRKRLEEVSKQTSLRLDVVQQDYILSWLLLGIFEHPVLKSNLIFKGGTALKKGYFGEYRFSEDLDFSTRGELPEDFEKSITEACKHAEMQMREFSPIRLYIKKYEEKMPHPEGQQAFVINAQFPWQSQPLTKAMIEISCNEMVLLEPVLKNLIHPYGEPINLEMHLYSLEEIILEKLRAILQHTKKLHERDWSRSRARDYYDLWRIFGMFEKGIDFERIKENLPLKCSHKRVSFKGPTDFFDEKMISYVSKTWNQWLGPLVRDLPDSPVILEELKTKIPLCLP
ncbi:MAG: nucleotidyl transferase AbiEii/AbiGii toxin family protein [Chlamydiales bacterium]|nr:nucleotidyl transferase AbiEii/AbiGii toxin family protein [Chlamydiales bacterium]